MTFTFTSPTPPFEAGEGLEQGGAGAQDVWERPPPAQDAQVTALVCLFLPAVQALTAESGLPGLPVCC